MQDRVRRVEHFCSTAVPGLPAKPIVVRMAEAHFREHWDRLLFRDYLAAHPDAAKRYGELKLGLASAWAGDRPAYARGKAAFIEEVTGEAGRLALREAGR